MLLIPFPLVRNRGTAEPRNRGTAEPGALRQRGADIPLTECFSTMYPADDTVAQLRVAIVRARALRDRLRQQVDWTRSLGARLPRPPAIPDARTTLIRDARETQETSRRLVEEAREQVRQAHALVADSRRHVALRRASEMCACGSSPP